MIDKIQALLDKGVAVALMVRQDDGTYKVLMDTHPILGMCSGVGTTLEEAIKNVVQAVVSLHDTMPVDKR